MASISIRDRGTGADHTGQSPESIVRRVWGRGARIIYSPDPNARWEARVVRTDRHGTHVLATLYLDEDALAAREGADLAAAATAYRQAEVAREAAWERLQAVTVAAIGEGLSESEAARQAGVDRMTVRKWAGKR